MTSTVSISQQYLLASKARAKLMKCAATEHNRDYDLRVLVGHANLLDRVMESVDAYNTSITRKADSKSRSGRSRAGGQTQVDYLSSDEEDQDDDSYGNSSSSSDSDYDDDDDQSSSADSDYDSDECETEQQPKYAPLKLSRQRQLPVSLVTVTIDQCLEQDCDDCNSETDSDSEESPTTEQDLSMMPLTLQAKGENQQHHFSHNALDNREFSEVTPIQV